MTPSRLESTLRGWWPVGLWAALILGVSSIPGETLGRVGITVPDLLAHCSEYAILGWLAYWRQRTVEGVGPARAVVTALLLGIALGALDESYQRLIPGRFSSWTDWAADSVGTAIGVAVAHGRHYRIAARDGRGRAGQENRT